MENEHAPKINEVVASIREQKSKVETSLLEIIRTFEKETGLNVQAVNLIKAVGWRSDPGINVRVELEIKL